MAQETSTVAAWGRQKYNLGSLSGDAERLQLLYSPLLLANRGSGLVFAP